MTPSASSLSPPAPLCWRFKLWAMLFGQVLGMVLALVACEDRADALEKLRERAYARSGKGAPSAREVAASRLEAPPENVVWARARSARPASLLLASLSIQADAILPPMGGALLLRAPKQSPPLFS